MLFSGNVANGRVVLPSHNYSLVLKSGRELKVDFIYEISRQCTDKQSYWKEFFFRSPSIYLILAYGEKFLHGRLGPAGCILSCD